MNIIAKHTLHSVFKNPWQSMIIILSMLLITASIFVIFCMSDVFIFTSERFDYAGSSFADIRFNEMRYDKFAELKGMMETEPLLSQNVAECIGTYQTDTYAETEDATTKVTLRFADAAKYIEYSKCRYKAKAKNNTAYPSIYIPSSYSKTAGVGAGEVLIVNSTITSNEFGHKYFVSGVMEEFSVFFATDSYLLLADVPNDGVYAPDYYVPYIYLKDPQAVLPDGRSAKTAVFEFLKENFPDNTMSTDIAMPSSKQNAKKNQMILSIALGAMIILMALMLYFSYSIIAKNRLEEIVRFKAAGATPAQSTLILLSEAFIYALIGCPLGLGAGRLLMQYACDVLLDGMAFAINMSAWKYLAALAIGIAAAIAACLIPSAVLSKKSLRSLTSEGVKIARKPSVPAFIFSTALLVAMFAAAFTVSGDAVMPCSIALTVAAAIWIAAAVPCIVALISKLIKKLPLKGGTAVAPCGVKRNSSVITIATLLSALMAFMWLGTMIVDLVLFMQKNHNARFTADYTVTTPWRLEDDEMVEICESLPGAEDVCYHYSISILSINMATDPAIPIMCGYSITDGKFLKYFMPEIDTGTVERFNNTDNPVVISRKQAGDFNIKIGDKLRFSSSFYGALSTQTKMFDEEFEVVGIDNTVTSWDAHMCVKTSSVRKYIDKGLIANRGVYFNGDKTKFKEYREIIREKTMGETENDHAYIMRTQGGCFVAASLDEASKLLNFLIVIFYSIAALGMLNIIYVAESSRKTENHNFTLAGMTRGQLITMRFTEGIIIGSSALLSGLVISLALNSLRPIFALILRRYVGVSIFPLKMLWICLISFGAFMMLWIAGGALAGRKNKEKQFHRIKSIKPKDKIK